MTASHTAVAAERAEQAPELPAPALLGGLDRRDRRRGRPARLGHPRLVLEPLGHDHRDLGRLHRRRRRAQDRPDDADRVRLVLDPPLRLLDDELQGRARLLRDLGGAERLPPGEHRHLRDAADVHHDHRRRDLLGRARRLRGREDLLHRHRGLHVPLPLPLGRRLVRHQVRLRARAPVGDGDPAARRGLPDLPADPRLLAEGRRAGGTTRRRAAASSASRGSTSSASSRRRCSAGSRVSA